MEAQALKNTQVYNKFTKRKHVVIGTLVILLFILIIASTSMGTASIGFKGTFYVIASKIFSCNLFNNVSDLNDTVIMQIRLPRVLTAVIIGASLAGTGAVMQGVLRNPLVSEYTLGLSSGAAFGAGLAIVLGTNILGNNFLLVDKYIIVFSSFIFGMLTMVLVHFIAKLKSMAPGTLILAGVAISYLFSALLSILKYISNQEQLRDIVFWLMGGLWLSNWSTVAILLPITVVSFVLMIKYAWDLNALGSGDEVATSLGINVNKVRIICLMLASLSSSSCVAFTGIIGFVGLVAPHTSRIVIGSDHRFLIPCSSLMGAILLLLADTVSRTIISPTEIPVGIVTSLIGAPFFIYLLVKERRRCWV